MAPYQTIIQWITPEEVEPITAAMTLQAARIREIANKVLITGQSLDGTWTGGAKGLFFSKFSGLPGELNAFADELVVRALNVAAISVWLEIQEWFEN